MASASIRSRRRADGTVAYAVLYQVDGTQTSLTFDDEQGAPRPPRGVYSIGVD